MGIASWRVSLEKYRGATLYGRRRLGARFGGDWFGFYLDVGGSVEWDFDVTLIFVLWEAVCRYLYTAFQLYYIRENKIQL